MANRYVSIWFRYLSTDWFSLRQPQLKSLPFVLRTPVHGRMIVTAVNAVAQSKGIHIGMTLADARALHPELEIHDDKPELIDKLLARIAQWCIRFTPIVATDPPDGLLLDVTGCTHLWGGDDAYIKDITLRLQHRGYSVRLAMADTAALAWGVARYGKEPLVVNASTHLNTLMRLPPEALRPEPDVVERLHKLGLHRIEQFMNMPRSALRRRFGNHFIQRINMALGKEVELIKPIVISEPYQERLPCLEPIVTLTGIEIALQELLKLLCLRLQQEQKGLRTAVFKCYRVDGRTEQIDIGTNRPSHHIDHLFKLFALKIGKIEPALGIELFVLEAPQVEDCLPQQEKMWQANGGLEDMRVSELIDRLAGKVGIHSIHRYVPAEHYWPERSFKQATTLHEATLTEWRDDKLRPLQLLEPPELIEVSAPIPDYPPMLFRRKGNVHKIVKAEGPERIEQEWWLQQGQHRDYYRVEDDAGHRYWLFRLGHYEDKNDQWFLHGFFA